MKVIKIKISKSKLISKYISTSTVHMPILDLNKKLLFIPSQYNFAFLIKQKKTMEKWK